jgi:hypothetical protein
MFNYLIQIGWVEQVLGNLFVVCFILLIVFIILFILGIIRNWNEEEEEVRPEIKTKNKGLRIIIDEKAKTITLDVGDSYKVDTKKKNQQGKKQR